jgi:hypothetical protein
MSPSPRSKYCSLIQQTFGILRKRYHVLYGLQTTTDRPCTARWVVTECVILRTFGIQLVKFSKMPELLVLTGNNALAAVINMSDDAVGCIVRDHNIIRDTYFL